MSALTDLRAALEAKHEAVDAVCKTLAEPLPLSEVAYLELYSALGTYRKLRTDDTIRALLDVAEAAEREPRCPFCSVFRNIRGVERKPHLADCPLASLVKEADHDRA